MQSLESSFTALSCRFWSLVTLRERAQTLETWLDQSHNRRLRSCTVHNTLGEYSVETFMTEHVFHYRETKSKPSGWRIESWQETYCDGFVKALCCNLQFCYRCHDHSFCWLLSKPIWAECCSNKLFIIMSDAEDARKHHTVAIKLLSCGAASSKSILCATKPPPSLCRVLGPDADQENVLQDSVGQGSVKEKTAPLLHPWARPLIIPDTCTT